MRVVLDTNVIVSSFLSALGNPATIREAWRRGEFEVALSEPILAELRHTLVYPRIVRRLGWSPEQVDQVVEDLRSIAMVVEEVPALPASVRDPQDNMLLECADATRADLVVTGDKDLLVLGQFRDVPIVTPARFVEILAAAAQQP